MSDLVQQIRDAIAERRELAEHLNRFHHEHPEIHERWTVARDEERLVVYSTPGGNIRETYVLDVSFLNGDLADHVCANDPAAVLALCKAAEELLSLSDDLWQYDPDSTEFRAARRIRASVAAMFGVDASVSPTSKTDQRTEHR